MRSNSARNEVEYECAKLGIGQEIQFHKDLFEEAFPCGYPSIYNTHREAFLSTRVGSAWGCWRCYQNPQTGNYTVSRHNGEFKRVYCDPDREHLYIKDKDGYLIPRF